jgi:hypothetical protein
MPIGGNILAFHYLPAATDDHIIRGNLHGFSSGNRTYS